MEEVRRVASVISEVDHGDPWHGSSTRSILEGVTAQDAAMRPIPGAHTIWEITLHMTVWAREVRKRLLGGDATLPAEGDWPVVPPAAFLPATGVGVPTPADEAWTNCLIDLASAHASLVAALDDFPAARLDEPVGTSRDRVLGTGTTYGFMLYGVALHDAYHAGQIALIRKAIGGL
jgi:hypothetical protein